jgi:hypothetical protein
MSSASSSSSSPEKSNSESLPFINSDIFLASNLRKNHGHSVFLTVDSNNTKENDI